MKKIFSVVLIIAVVFTVFSVNTVTAFADADEVVAPYASFGQSVYSTGEETYVPPFPIDLDGYIDEAEGWVCVTPDFVNKTIVSSEYRFDAWQTNASVEILDGEDVGQFSSNLKYYVAQDDTDVYIGIVDYAPYFEVDGTEGFSRASESLTRNQYSIRIGFDSSDYSRALFIREVNGIDQLNMITENSYVSINDDDHEGLFTYSFVRYDKDYTVVIAQKNDLSVNTQNWTKPAYQWIAHIEMKINKELIKEVYSEVYTEGSDAGIDFKTLFISASASACRPDPAASNTYAWSYPVYGTIVSPEVAKANSLPERYIPDIVVFEDLYVETEVVTETEVQTGNIEDTTSAQSTTELETEFAESDSASETMPAQTVNPTDTETEKEEVTTALDSTSTNAPTDIEDKKSDDNGSNSCGGTVSLAGIALIASVGACATCFSKKKEI